MKDNAQSATASTLNAASPNATYLKDYTAPSHWIDTTSLIFDLGIDKTTVKARLSIRRNLQRDEKSLRLHAEKMEIVSVKIEGSDVAYTSDDKWLVIENCPDVFTLETEVIINPEANTALSGLYMSNGMFCTQCESEGFRNITPFLDRPDVLSVFDVKIIADKNENPVLLSNGNKTDAGDLTDNKHFASWADPHPKPAYLFALVGGDLAHVEDRFTTMSGRVVTLQVFVQPQNIDKCDYTMESLKRSMKWDEEVFGREYDLDIFMIVAVDHFNFGAMENKGLNIFNSAYVLASPETATDLDYELIESIVGHEYFHNWSGNRVTCRDWFQLCLKEGFTVFRDQEFSADMRERHVQRIFDVQRLWARQFPEDAGALAHPVRPQSFMTIDNFYTATVYDKGAELVRMLKTMLGAENFRKGSDLYFDKNDGTAATVEDFIGAMAEVSGRDLGQFMNWYNQAGRPNVTVTDHFENGVYSLHITQKTAATAGQETKTPQHMPMKMALIDQDGMISHAQIVEITEDVMTLSFDGFAQKPVASLFRGLSAPITLHQSLSLQERLHLIRYDDDQFNRFNMARDLAIDIIAAFADAKEFNGDQATALQDYGLAMGGILADKNLDDAFKAEMLKAPSINDVMRVVAVIDPDAIAKAIKHFKKSMWTANKDGFAAAYDTRNTPEKFTPDSASAGKRKLKNICLDYMTQDQAAWDKVANQARQADNMTDEAAAMVMVLGQNNPYKEGLRDEFYSKWQAQPLVVNKWLAWQAMSGCDNVLDDIKALTQHEAFDMKNPNKVRSLIGAFAANNVQHFHAADGSGYDFIFEKIRELDGINPQVAARMMSSVEAWRSFEPKRKAMMRNHLASLVNVEGLSANVFEMATRLLGDD